MSRVRREPSRSRLFVCASGSKLLLFGPEPLQIELYDTNLAPGMSYRQFPCQPIRPN